MAEPTYTRHVEKLWPELEELFAAGDRLEELVAAPGWADLHAVLNLEIARIDKELDGARTPLGRADYALAHGRRDGLRAALRAADAIISRASEERENQRIKHEADGESSAGGS